MFGTASLLEMGLSVPLWDLSPTASFLQQRWVQEAWKDLGSQHNQRGGISPSPWSNLLPLLSTMLAAICAVCTLFALAFHFIRFWDL